MKKSNIILSIRLFFLLLVVLNLSCNNENSLKYPPNIDIVPNPKEIVKHPLNEALEIDNTISVYISSPDSKNFYDLFTNDLKIIFSQNLNFKRSDKINSDINFVVENSLKDEEYQIEIDKNISIVGGSYNAITMAKSSLIQIIKYKDNNTLLLPKAKISDKPDSSYRGLMIDLSRMWHDLESIRNVIDMASLYKIKFL